MLKLVIAEDEDIIRMGLVQTIDWQAMEVELVGEAADGMEALEQVKNKAVGFNVGGKIGIARCGEHLCVAIYMGVGVLNLNEMCVGLAHRSLASDE